MVDDDLLGLSEQIAAGNGCISFGRTVFGLLLLGGIVSQVQAPDAPFPNWSGGAAIS